MKLLRLFSTKRRKKTKYLRKWGAREKEESEDCLKLCGNWYLVISKPLNINRTFGFFLYYSWYGLFQTEENDFKFKLYTLWLAYGSTNLTPRHLSRRKKIVHTYSKHLCSWNYKWINQRYCDKTLSFLSFTILSFTWAIGCFQPPIMDWLICRYNNVRGKLVSSESHRISLVKRFVSISYGICMKYVWWISAKDMSMGSTKINNQLKRPSNQWLHFIPISQTISPTEKKRKTGEWNI